MREGARGAAVRLDNLVKQFPHTDAPAVRGLDLDITPGEFMTFLGPSGSGKTTTLNMIAGFESATAGSVLIGGQDVSGLPPHRRDVGMVFQDYALFPHMTVAQNIAFPLQQRKLPKKEIAARVADVLAKVQLEGFGGRYPRQMSGGQQQRVAVARAIVYNPRVLLLDEPLGALDKRLRAQMQVEMTWLHREVGLTFLLVTHDQDEALSMSDRIAVFHEGGIEQVGTPIDLYERPESLFVAEFLGASNVLRGRVEAGGQLLRCEHCLLKVPAGEVSAGPGALVLRPDSLKVLAAGDHAGDDRNVLDADVAETIYLGSVRQLVLRLPWGERVTVREAMARRSAAERGDRVRVAWRSGDGVVLSEGSGTQAGSPLPVG